MADRTPQTITTNRLPAIDAAGLTYSQALVLVSSYLQHLVTTQDYAARTVAKAVADMASLSAFMTAGKGKPLLAQTTAGDVAEWVESNLGGRRRNGEAAAATTRRLRRTHARSLYRVLRGLDLFDWDPTLDIGAHPGVSGTTLPLCDADLLLLRLICDGACVGTRLPSLLALAEATASTGEMAIARIRDIDLDDASVLLRGTRHLRRRRVPLSRWGVGVLRRRITQLLNAGADEHSLLVYAGDADPRSSESPGASTAGAVGDLLRQAGLHTTSGVKPRSIGLAYAQRVWDQHQDIRLVARVMGYGSHDKAARALGIDLHETISDDAAETALRASLLHQSDPASHSGVVRHRPGRRPSGSTPAARPATATATARNSRARTGHEHE